MECSCNAGSCYDDGDITGYSERMLRAGKQHICPECGKAIEKGEYFMFCTTFIPGEIYNSKMCLDCYAIVAEFFKDGYVSGQVHDDLGDYLYHTWHEDLPSNCISKLPAGAKVVVCDILQEFQEAAQ